MFDASRIKLGDYVETRDGRIGYVRNFNVRENTFICSVWYKDDLVVHQGNIVAIPLYFKQIGAYKFDEVKASNKKIEKFKKYRVNEAMINDNVLYRDLLAGLNSVNDKLNEAIDRINEME